MAVVSSSTKRTLSISTPPVFVPISVVSIVALDVTHDTGLSSFAPVVLYCDVTPATALINTPSALLPPIPVLPRFASSPLAFPASAPQPLNTPASAVVPGVAFRRLCCRPTSREAEYTHPKGRFVAKEAGVERLTAKVQTFTDQVTVF